MLLAHHSTELDVFCLSVCLSLPPLPLSLFPPPPSLSLSNQHADEKGGGEEKGEKDGGGGVNNDRSSIEFNFYRKKSDFWVLNIPLRRVKQQLIFSWQSSLLLDLIAILLYGRMLGYLITVQNRLTSL